MFTIEWARSASEYRSRTWTALSPSRRAADAAHAPGETQMMLRTQWDPFEDLRGAQDELRERMPALDISERKDAYLITVELPGVQLDDVQITMEDRLLTIQGERHIANDSSEQQFHRIERRYGAFRRSITLPAHVMADAVQATVEDGVLQIVVPKMEEAKPKRIQVLPGRASIPAASGEGEAASPS